MDLFAIKDALVPLVHEGAELAVRMRERGLQESTKVDGTIVTDADLAVSELLLARMPALIPGATIVTEEHAPETIDWSKPVWLVDPIDGTNEFVARGALWGCSATLVVDAEAVLTVHWLSTEQELLWAIKGEGAYRNSDGADTRLFAPEKPQWTLAIAGETGYRTGTAVARSTIRGLLAILDGKYAAYAQVGIAAWDLWPMALLLTEAGGQVLNQKHQLLRPTQLFEQHVVLVGALSESDLASLLQ